MDAAEWTAATSGEKDQALVAATYRLEQERYVGSVSSTAQRLQWPRIGAPDKNAPQGYAGDVWGLPYGGWVTSYYDSTTMPQTVKEACYEMALALLKDETLLSDTGLEGFENVKIGPMDVTPRQGFSGGDLPAQVIRCLRGLRSPIPGTTRVVRG